MLLPRLDPVIPQTKQSSTAFKILCIRNFQERQLRLRVNVRIVYSTKINAWIYFVVWFLALDIPKIWSHFDFKMASLNYLSKSAAIMYSAKWNEVVSIDVKLQAIIVYLLHCSINKNAFKNQVDRVGKKSFLIEEQDNKDEVFCTNWCCKRYISHLEEIHSQIPWMYGN